MSERRTVLGVVAVIGVAVVWFAPYLLDDFWLTLGATVFATAIGAIGLMVLFGRVGQLSLGHPFFLAIGAYGYIALTSTDDTRIALGWPPVLALVVAAVGAGVAGAVLSPVAARLKGLNLGLATLSLIFIGSWACSAWQSLTGGYNGRAVPPFTLLGFSTADGFGSPIAGLELNGADVAWYLTALVLVLVIAFTALVLRGRVGRAFTAIRDAETHAAALGVEVGRYRAVAFALSSLYAGLAGALIAVLTQFLTPDYFSLTLALNFLAMVVIGGLRSIAGAVIGAALVTALPAVLQNYGDALPGLSTTGSGGVSAAVVAEVAYGAILVVLLLVEPEGITALVRRLR